MLLFFILFNLSQRVYSAENGGWDTHTNTYRVRVRVLQPQKRCDIDAKQSPPLGGGGGQQN